MRRHQIKRARPTFQTAHEFFQGAGFSIGPEHRLTDEEWEADVKKTQEELSQVTKLQFPRTASLEFAILKSHLIAEYAITSYIRCFSNVHVDRKSIKFGFSQKIETAYLMGFGVNDPIVLPTIERLNKIRNQVAHTFELNRALVDEMLQINFEEYKELDIPNDRERIRLLRWVCYSVCGRISGEIVASYYMSKYPLPAL